jgi:dethiobiotin synthetase
MKTAECRIIFITGTDTGVGKTVLTGLLLHHLREGGTPALAMKPFCSGGTADVDLLQSFQHGELTVREMNPFYFSEPIAPLVAARRHHRTIELRAVTKAIFNCAARCPCLLIEGSGGLLVPLGEGLTVADLIAKLRCETLVVSRNRLGTINHTLLTVRALQDAGNQRLKVVMMGCQKRDASSRSNAATLAELLAPVPLVEVPFLGPKPLRPAVIKNYAKKVKKMLARILE